MVAQHDCLARLPIPVPFILNTSGDDDCNVDCFVLTTEPLKSGQIVACEPVAWMQQIEDGEEDHNVLAATEGQWFELNEDVKRILTEFVMHVFEHISDKNMQVGEFLSQSAAVDYVTRHADVISSPGTI